MDTYTITTPRGDSIDVQANDQATAIKAAQTWDMQDYAQQAAQKAGVDPALAIGVLHQESRSNPNAVSPKGALGPMQLMPGTAKDLGVDPSDPYQNIDGGVKYLKQQLDAFGGDARKALAAYNAGPGAVQKYGGVPPFKETQDYVGAIMGDGAPAAAPSAPKRPPPITAAPGLVKASAPASPTIAQDAVSGFLRPFQTLGHDVMQRSRELTARAQGPLPSLPDAARQSVSDVVGTFKGLGDMLGLTSAPVQAVVKPVARAITNYGPTPYAPPSVSIQNGRPVFAAGAPLKGDAAQAANEGLINTALSGMRPATARVPIPKAMTLEELSAAKKAAYQAADAAGVQYTPKAFGNLASDINSEIAAAKFNPMVHENTAAVVGDINQLAASGHAPTLTELDQLRQVVGRDVISGGTDGEQMMGKKITGAIDDFIDNAKPSDLVSGSASNASDLITTARDLNTRFRKVQEVTDRTDSAMLKVPQNGSITTPVRTAMRPLVDPKSPQQMRNLTPAETAALQQLARGKAGQNITNTLGRFLDPRSLVGATTNMMLGAVTGGHAPIVTAPLGIASTIASNRGTQSAIQNVIDLMSRGGLPAGAQPLPILQLAGRPGLSVASPAGLTGAGVVAAPLARLPAPPSAPTSSRKRAGQRGR